MNNVINHTELSDTLELTECTDGFWLYDKTRRMNLSMKAKTAQDAFVEALEYYQERLKEVEKDYNELKSKIDTFVGQFRSQQDIENEEFCDSYR